MKHKISFLVAIFILKISLTIAQDQLCFPIGFRSITPGLTANDDVEKILGKGYFDQNSGHIGSYNYLNENKSLVLSVGLGMNAYVESVVIQNAKFAPDSEISKYPISNNFVPVTIYSVSNLIGSSSESIKQKFGVPSYVNDKVDNEIDFIWGFESDVNSKPCYIYSSIYFWFKNNEVATLIISNDLE